MKRKLKQVTDNVHETIYLSSFESELISTPYFYRLHDIYQSSTVYMTFPSNRTKRYEHSLGTMEMASSILFSAVSNADDKTKLELFKELNSKFGEIMDAAFNNYDSVTAEYFTKNKTNFETIFGQITSSDNIINNIISDVKKAVENSLFSDSALDFYQFYPMVTETNQQQHSTINFFLYRCLLQAVRIVALFHDVGHPPYSHIVEEALDILYSKYEAKTDGNDKIIKFVECLKPYSRHNKDGRSAYKCNAIYSTTSLSNAALHERIGLNFLMSAINDTFSDIINEISLNGNNDYGDIANVIYYITIVEFAISMLVEKDNFFKSFHKIVDGTLDADRLDYVIRDTKNSGVDWGNVAYKRLINSARLKYFGEDDLKKGSESDCEDKNRFVVAYPKKNIADIEDLLLLRYKIFVRINFHHRCMKTSVSLQESIIKLAENYFFTSDENEKDCINSEINSLWMSLSKTISKKPMRIIQWNDSWLISVLHKSLVRLDTTHIRSNNNELKENLEEILLNKKKYHSLFKRGTDCQHLIHNVFDEAGIEINQLLELREREYIKYYSNKTDDKKKMTEIMELSESNALDSIKRINNLIEAYNTGNVNLLFDESLPLMDDGVQKTINSVLEELRLDKYIVKSKMVKSVGVEKTGMPLHDDLFGRIYLYDDYDDFFFFNPASSLSPQIDALRNSIPGWLIYFVPNEQDNTLINITKEINERIQHKLAISMKNRFEELFGK